MNTSKISMFVFTNFTLNNICNSEQCQIEPIYMQHLQRYQTYLLNISDSGYQNNIMSHFIQCYQKIFHEKLYPVDLIIVEDLKMNQWFLVTNIDIDISIEMNDDDIEYLFHSLFLQYAIPITMNNTEIQQLHEMIYIK